MLRSILKTVCIVLISSILTYFLIGLVEYKEKILSTIKYISKKSSDIVILTGGTNRIKDGLKILFSMMRAKISAISKTLF